MTRTSRLFDRLESEGGYTVEQYSYPSDLANESFGQGHWILFTINAVQGSKLERNSRQVRPIDGIGNTPQIQTDNLVRSREVFGGRALTKRINSAIALYMPENITTTSELSWEQGEINAGVTGALAYNSATNTLENFDGAMLSDMISSVGDVFGGITNMQNLLDFSQVALSNTELANSAALYRRQFRNPYMEFLFRGVNPRTFNFEFKFFPRSQQEVENVRNIITAFRTNAHPELITSGGILGSFYRYPNEFDITLMSNTTENKFLRKISTCALTSIVENDTPQGQLSFFEEIPGEGSPPTGISLTLTFTELELMNRQRIEDGF